MRHTSSPVLSPALASASDSASSLEKRPAYVLPSAVTIAPVSVARSMMRSAPSAAA